MHSLVVSGVSEQIESSLLINKSSTWTLSYDIFHIKNIYYSIVKSIK